MMAANNLPFFFPHTQLLQNIGTNSRMLLYFVEFLGGEPIGF
jgi:hypothetical protein